MSSIDPEVAYNEVSSIAGIPNPSLKSICSIYNVSTTAFSYGLIKKYVENGRPDGSPLALKKLYKISRKGDPDFKDEDHRILLWHGTKRGNIGGILNQSFRKGAGGCYGGGVYFADRIAKSVGYSDGHYMLCEVKLGRKYKAQFCHSEYGAPPPGFDSVKGMGQQIPKWRDNRTYYGAIVPVGPTILNTRYEKYTLAYNEYIVYDPNQIVIRFLAIVN